MADQLSMKSKQQHLHIDGLNILTQTLKMEFVTTFQRRPKDETFSMELTQDIHGRTLKQGRQQLMLEIC